MIKLSSLKLNKFFFCSRISNWKLEVQKDWRKLRISIDRLETEINTSTCQIPSSRMCTLLIVAEDHRFEKHFGVDLIALIRAMWKTFFMRKPQGASTIAMQLTRTLTGNYDRTIRRKVVEILLAILLTRYISKDKIPLLYLWCGYYGWRMNNFTQACERLNLKPNSMSLIEEAELVARLKYPQPQRINEKRVEKIKARGNYIIARLEQYNPEFQC
ncbi:MAG: transglycosylase domain-containing protein [Paracoccaceae bacterium]|nr:transglycosylase domain-containing protein [Paracoccaceae bacterium]MDE2917033.1 transglycosylase domain-containing protein [Paracoccaceae bacterium]